MRIRLAFVVKMLGFVLGGCMAIVVAAALLAWITFDANGTMAAVSDAFRDRYDRTLRAGEAPQLTLWPRPAVVLGKVTLSDPHRNDVFARVEEVRARLSLLPLLMRQTQVHDLRLKGVDLRLVHNRDGGWNFSDLLAEGPQSDSPDSLRLDSLSVRDGQLRLEDQRTARSLKLTQLSLQTGAIRDGIPDHLQAQADVSDPASGTEAKLKLSSSYLLKRGLEAGALTDLRLDVDGNALGLQGATLSVSADRLGWVEQMDKADVANARLHLGGARQSQSMDVTANVASLSWDELQLKGQKAALRVIGRTVERETEWRVEAPVLLPQASGFTADSAQFHWRHKAGANTSSGEIAGHLQADLQTGQVRADALAGDLNLALPALQSAKTATKLTGSVKWQAGEGGVADLDLDLRAGTDALHLNAQLRRLQPLGGRFRIESTRLDLDHLLSRAAGATAPVALPLPLLDQADLTGQLKLTNLHAQGLNIASVQVPVVIAGGRLAATGFALSLYGGTLGGDFTAELGAAPGVGRMAAKGEFQSLDLGRLAKDSSASLPLTGVASGSYDLNTLRRSDATLLAGLRGALRWTCAGGVLRGVDLAHSLKEFKPAIHEGRNTARTPSAAENTELQAAASRFVFDNGKMQAERIEARNGWMTLLGAGSADLVRGEMDFGLLTKLQTPPAELADLRGKTVPLRIKGEPLHPDVRLEPVAVVEDKKGRR